ncbi:hypothetical protein [Polaromonas glacialis]|uniref:hypothetical protein n=1 Tax=Polaromonas glacialis TaxID=866564 RepID=UPI0012EC336B|nr:hypothetical protein [Polaromonas glacialis]
MSNLSSKIAKTIASAVVTAAALSGNVMAASCAGAKCGPKQATSSKAKCGACKSKYAASSVKGSKNKTVKAKCGACSAKCGACAAVKK